MPSETSSVTLDDVAKAAGVSTATVSRCLNLPDRVAAQTLARVMRTIEELGYTPNFGARVMAAKRTLTVGAIIPTMENAIFARGLQAFQEALHLRGYTLLVSSTGYSPEVEVAQIQALVARGADALLLIGYDRDPQIYTSLARRNIPALVAWAYAENATLPCVGFDNRNAMAALTAQVLAIGHRRIAVISAHTNGNDRAAGRLDGINDALHAAGLGSTDLTVIETAYGIQNGADAFDILLAGHERPTVVMCGNDVLAAGALRRAQQLGFRVPEDISITGFDDIDLASIVTPGLTTVHVPHREMGQRAATELINIIEKSGADTSVELQTYVQMRGSLGPPPLGF